MKSEHPENSITKKIHRYVILSTILPFGSLFLFFLLVIYPESRRYVEVELKTLTLALASEYSDLLKYRELGGEEKIRSSLKTVLAQPDFEMIGLYSGDGLEVIESVRPGLDPRDVGRSIDPRSGAMRLSMDQMEISRPINVDTGLTGRTETWWLYISRDSRSFRQDLVLTASGIGAILVVTLVVGFYLSRKLQQKISCPLQDLLSQMETIGKTRDYSIRVHVDCDAEIAAVSQGLNSMLARIQEQDELLKHSRTSLEAKVHERTGELQAEIEKRKEYERQLTDALDHTEAASRAKSEFLAVMSHEIRTPLNGILGMAALVGDTRLNDEQQEYVSAIIDSGNSLITLINDVLDFSRIESGKMVLERTELCLEKLVSEVVMTFRASFQKKGIVLTNEVSGPPVSETLLEGDPARVRQVLLNLVGNALKFTEKGQVDIRLNKFDVNRESRQVHIILSVRDTGIGIPEDKIEQIFEKFQQADCSTTRQYGGSGLGLSICTRLANMMDGGIRVQSSPGTGSEFFFEFVTGLHPVCADGAVPMQKSRKETESQSEPGPLRILLAEDHPVNQMLTRRLLEKRGHTVTVAADGIEALKHAADTAAWDVILMDLHMPGLGGLEVIRQIRQSESGSAPPSSPVPVIALTASVTTMDREACMDAGADDFIAKPVCIPELMVKISRHVHRSRQSRPTRS